MLPRQSEPASLNPEMLILAREARGWSQREAAGNLGISQARLSQLETGIASAPAEFADKASAEFGYPPEFFGLRHWILGPSVSEFFHRKRQATPVKALRRLHAEMNVRMINISRLLLGVETPEDNIPRIDPEEGYSPAQIADLVRVQWALPAGPIPNLTAAIEKAGGIVVTFDFGTTQVDAVSRYAPAMPRVFFVNSSMPADRQRMTLAHELGHVVMHQIPHPDMETQGYQFAAEFLMPERDIKPQFDRVTIAKLYTMKPYWKVSMAALLKRACDLDRVPSERYLWMQMSKAGYRTREPAEVDIPYETPRLLEEIVRVHQEELGYGPKEMGRLMLINEQEAEDKFGVMPTVAGKRTSLRLVHNRDDQSAR